MKTRINVTEILEKDFRKNRDTVTLTFTIAGKFRPVQKVVRQLIQTAEECGSVTREIAEYRDYTICQDCGSTDLYSAPDASGILCEKCENRRK